MGILFMGKLSSRQLLNRGYRGSREGVQMKIRGAGCGAREGGGLTAAE